MVVYFFPMIMVMGLFVIHVIIHRTMFLFLCLVLTLCLTVRLSAFELLIVSALVRWWLASNHYLYHGWPSYGTSYLIITCVIHKIMHLWIMVIIFLGDIELIMVSDWIFAVALLSIHWNRCNFLAEILIMHSEFASLKINPLLLTFLGLTFHWHCMCLYYCSNS